MKTRTCISILLTASALAFAACSLRYGSVSEEGVKEALFARDMAITPHEPGWLLDKKKVYKLSDEQLEQVRTILRPEKTRKVSEDYYRDDEQGNRGDESPLVFYLYASNAQCLGGRIVGRTLLMDDFDLTKQDSEQLYKIFRPLLIKIFPGKKLP